MILHNLSFREFYDSCNNWNLQMFYVISKIPRYMKLYVYTTKFNVSLGDHDLQPLVQHLVTNIHLKAIDFTSQVTT